MTPSFPRDGVSGKPGVVQRSVSTTGKTSPESAKPRTGSKKPFNAASPSHSWRRPSPSCGTPPTPTPKRRSLTAAEKPPGTPPKPSRPRWTCSTPCATRSPRTELTPQPQVTPHPNKTRTSRSAPNGLPHNSESRVGRETSKYSKKSNSDEG